MYKIEISELMEFNKSLKNFNVKFISVKDKNGDRQLQLNYKGLLALLVRLSKATNHYTNQIKSAELVYTFI